MNESWGCYASEISQERERQILCDLTYMWNLKNKKEKENKKKEKKISQNEWRGSKVTNFQLVS